MKKMSQWPHLEVFGLQGLVGFTVVKDSQVSHPCRGVRTLETAKKGYYQESEKFSSKDVFSSKISAPTSKCQSVRQPSNI